MCLFFSGAGSSQRARLFGIEKNARDREEYVYLQVKYGRICRSNFVEERESIRRISTESPGIYKGIRKKFSPCVVEPSSRDSTRSACVCFCIHPSFLPLAPERSLFLSLRCHVVQCQETTRVCRSPIEKLVSASTCDTRVALLDPRETTLDTGNRRLKKKERKRSQRANYRMLFACHVSIVGIQDVLKTPRFPIRRAARLHSSSPRPLSTQNSE